MCGRNGSIGNSFVNSAIAINSFYINSLSSMAQNKKQLCIFTQDIILLYSALGGEERFVKNRGIKPVYRQLNCDLTNKK